ncbi:DNA-binding XRE family transcriptional regulator [Aurantimicrobium minutum]|uniref:helix-turn-helix transcriptional regulator n=1 Tax=Aurantimicrobium minutum TaxID=708131 RepID=UPI002472FAAA|nr:helix-turn-helix transcriptional regulator [Aurantimicrobium minutum]MDH6277595.1 DNA-binding XRE family transcriptional regulator [Aurantimicrobium minutum]
MDSTQEMTEYEAVKESLLAEASPVELQAYQRARDAALVRTNIAEMIYVLRQRAGLSQAQLAQRVGTSQTVISSLESGSRMPQLTTLMKIAEALGTSFEICLGDDSYSSTPMAS